MSLKSNLSFRSKANNNVQHNPPYTLIPFIDGSEDVEELDYNQTFDSRNKSFEINSNHQTSSRPSFSSQRSLKNAKAYQILGINTHSAWDEDSDDGEEDGGSSSCSSSQNHHQNSNSPRCNSPSFMSNVSKHLHIKSPSSSSSSAPQEDIFLERRNLSNSTILSSPSRKPSIGGLFGRKHTRNNSEPQQYSNGHLSPISSQDRIIVKDSMSFEGRRSYTNIDTRAAISAGWMRGPADEWPFNKPKRKKQSKSKNIPSILSTKKDLTKQQQQLNPVYSPALTAEFSDLHREESDWEEEELESHKPFVSSSSKKQIYKLPIGSSTQLENSIESDHDHQSNERSSLTSDYSTSHDSELFSSSSGSSTGYTSGVPSLVGSSSNDNHQSLRSSQWSCVTGRSSKIETIITPLYRTSHQKQYSPPPCPPPKSALPEPPSEDQGWKFEKTPQIQTRSSSRKHARPPLKPSNKEQELSKIKSDHSDENLYEQQVKCELMMIEGLPKIITNKNPRYGIIECPNDDSDDNSNSSPSPDDEKPRESTTFRDPRPAPSPPDGSGSIMRTYQSATPKMPAIITTRASTPASSLQQIKVEKQKEDVIEQESEQFNEIEHIFSYPEEDSPNERKYDEKVEAIKKTVHKLDGVEKRVEKEKEKEKEKNEICSQKSIQKEENQIHHSNDIPSPDTIARMVEQLLEEVPCSPIGKTISQILEEEKVIIPDSFSKLKRNSNNNSPSSSFSSSFNKNNSPICYTSSSISPSNTESSLVPSYYFRSPSITSSSQDHGFVLTFEAEETPIEEEEEEGEEENPIEKQFEEEEEKKAIHEQLREFLQIDETPSIELDKLNLNQDEVDSKRYSMPSLKSPLLPMPEIKNGEEKENIVSTPEKFALSEKHGFSTPLNSIKDQITFDGDYDAPSLTTSPSSRSSCSTMTNTSSTTVEEIVAEEDRAIRTVEDALDQILSDLPPMCLNKIEPLSPLHFMDDIIIPSTPITPRATKMNQQPKTPSFTNYYPKSPAPKALNVYKNHTPIHLSTSLSRPRPQKLFDPTTPRTLFPRGPITPRSPKQKKSSIPVELMEIEIEKISETPMKLEMDFDGSPMSMASFVACNEPLKKQDLIPSSPLPTPSFLDWQESLSRDNYKESSNQFLSPLPANIPLPRTPSPASIPLPKSPFPTWNQLPKSPLPASITLPRSPLSTPIPLPRSPSPASIPLPRSPLPTSIPLPKSPLPFFGYNKDNSRLVASKAPKKLTFKDQVKGQSIKSTLQVPKTAKELDRFTPFSPLKIEKKETSIHSLPNSPNPPLSLRALRSAKPLLQIEPQQNQERPIHLASTPALTVQGLQPSQTLLSRSASIGTTKNKINNVTSNPTKSTLPLPPPPTPTKKKNKFDNQPPSPIAIVDKMSTKNVILSPCSMISPSFQKSSNYSIKKPEIKPKSPKRFSPQKQHHHEQQKNSFLTSQNVQMDLMQTKKYVLPI